MRAQLTVVALGREPNRYLLTKLIAKATRKLHRSNTRVQDTDPTRLTKPKSVGDFRL